MIVNEFLTAPEAFLISWIMLGGFAFLTCAASAIAGWAVARSEGVVPRRWLWALPVIFGLWGGAALATSVTFRLDFVFLGPMILLPILGGWAMSYLPGLAGILARVPLHWLIAIQFYRVVGGLFLYYMARGILTPGFAWPAGIGDVATGLLALPVAWLVWRDPARWRWAFVAWTIFGIGDLIVAPAAAALYDFEAVEVELTFAITAIPLFLGPPFGILIHILTWRAYALQHPRGR